MRPRYIVSGDISGCIKVWDVETRRVSCESSTGHDGKGILRIRSLQNEGVEMLSQGRDGRIVFWRIEASERGKALQQTRVLRVGSATFATMTLCRSDSQWMMAAPCEEDHLCAIWDMQGLEKLAEFDVNECRTDGKKSGMLMCIQFLSCSIVGIGVEAGDVGFYDRSEGLICWHNLFGKEPVLCMDFFEQNGTYFGVVAGATSEIHMLEVHVSERLTISPRKVIKIKHPGISAVRVRQDGKIFATTGWDSRIRIFEFRTGRPLAILRQHAGTVNDLSFFQQEEDEDDDDDDDDDDTFKEQGEVVLERNMFVTGGKDHRVIAWSIY